jgi:hypothetical protein
MEKTCRTDIAWLSFYSLSDYLISFLSILRSFISIDWLFKHKKRKTANMKAYIRHYILWRPWSIIILKVNGDEWRWSKRTFRIRLWFEQNILLDLTTCGTCIYTAWSLLNWRLPTTSLFFFIFYFASCLDKEQANHHSDVPDTQLFNPSVQWFYVYAIFFFYSLE